MVWFDLLVGFFFVLIIFVGVMFVVGIGVLVFDVVL